MKHIEEQLKNIHDNGMTDSERSLMRSHVIAFMETYIPKNADVVKSPFMYFWNPLVMTMCSFIFIILGGTTLAYHASDALPGDFLYGFKVHVSEEVAGVLIKSSQEKILYQQQRVAKRLEEVKKLADEGTLTIENAAIAEKNIDTHIAKIDEDAKTLAKDNPKEFVETVNGLQPILDAHEKDVTELENIQKKEDQKDAELSELIKAGTVINPVSMTEALPGTLQKEDPKLKENVVDSIIAKVQKESDALQVIAQPILDKKDSVDTTEVKDSTATIHMQIEVPSLPATITQ